MKWEHRSVVGQLVTSPYTCEVSPWMLCWDGQNDCCFWCHTDTEEMRRFMGDAVPPEDCPLLKE